MLNFIANSQWKIRLAVNRLHKKFKQTSKNHEAQLDREENKKEKTPK